ncbi:unnamed protein product [Brassica oleracea]
MKEQHLRSGWSYDSHLTEEECRSIGSGVLLSSSHDSLVLFCHGSTTSSYVRRLQATLDMPLDSDVFRVSPGCNAPKQVQITQGDVKGKAVIVSWVTQKTRGSNMVLYWK